MCIKYEINYDEVAKQSKKWLDIMELDINPNTIVSELTVAKMQLCEIAKAANGREAKESFERISDASRATRDGRGIWAIRPLFMRTPRAWFWCNVG